jgi:lipoate-protein ligase B
VAYGIIDLRAWRIGVVDYVSGLEEAGIRLAAGFGVTATRRAGARGVWIEGRKLVSVGVHVSRGVTMHGIAINIDADLSPFDLINPCGMPGTEMTSLAKETGRAVPMSDAMAAFVRHFAGVFETQAYGDASSGVLTRAPDDILRA